VHIVLHGVCIVCIGVCVTSMWAYACVYTYVNCASGCVNVLWMGACVHMGAVCGVGCVCVCCGWVWLCVYVCACVLCVPAVAHKDKGTDGGES
jgi:hypothetical protein